MNELTQAFNSLLASFKTHVHNGTDSQIINIPKSNPVYAGAINADGSVVSLPTGWSCARNSAGYYIITHNLGTTKYSVTANLLSSLNISIIDIGNLGSTSFEIRIYKYNSLTTPPSWPATDGVSNFILSLF